jgi:hypothetical protein
MPVNIGPTIRSENIEDVREAGAFDVFFVAND